MTNKKQGYFTHFVEKDRMGERNKLEFAGAACWLRRRGSALGSIVLTEGVKKLPQSKNGLKKPLFDSPLKTRGPRPLTNRAKTAINHKKRGRPKPSSFL
jgi:hypothetical protein